MTRALKKVLFVCYGGGHVRMVVPVAKALQEQGLAQVQVLALTTAAGMVRESGLPLLQFKDFVGREDVAAIAHGRCLAETMADVADPEETHAYLGLSSADLVAEVGAEEAARRYERDGRQAFLPRRTLTRILRSVRPDLLVATNSPRAERAAIESARALGIPSVCIVDLFAIDEVRWIGQPAYADKVCVLNQYVKDFLIAAGRRAGAIEVTGNPAFDVLSDPAVVAQGRTLREARGWSGKRVLLWPEQTEPALHPFDGRPGDPTFPARTLGTLIDWTRANPDAVLCVRPRPGQSAPELPSGEQFILTGQDWPLPALLHAVDCVVTLTSTVGLEGHLAGTRLIQVLGSVFDDAMPLAKFGIADAAVPLPDLPAALSLWAKAGRAPTGTIEGSATARIVALLRGFI